MNLLHIQAACAGVILGCTTGVIVVVLFPNASLRADIALVLLNGAVIGVATLVVSLIKARRPPPP